MTASAGEPEPAQPPPSAAEPTEMEVEAPPAAPMLAPPEDVAVAPPVPLPPAPSDAVTPEASPADVEMVHNEETKPAEDLDKNGNGAELSDAPVAPAAPTAPVPTATSAPPPPDTATDPPDVPPPPAAQPSPMGPPPPSNPPFAAPPSQEPSIPPPAAPPAAMENPPSQPEAQDPTMPAVPSQPVPPAQEAATQPNPPPPNEPNASIQPPQPNPTAPVQAVAEFHQAPLPPQQQQPPPQNRPPVQAHPGMRELRVEDALLYLDDVKREFGDRPRIYNEFLEIMKNFKSHEVDTPGVIDRVSRLFRGYNKLILGFNKFLPDGYKISLEDLERQDAERQKAALAAAASAQQPYYPGGTVPQQQARGPQGQAAPPNRQGLQPSPPQGYPVKRPPPGAKPSPPVAGQQQRQSPPQPQAQQQRMAPQPPPQQQQPPQHQAVEFDHAISYVTNIKKRFANDPQTYHNFLEILHTYQKQQRGIKEVLEQVATLFCDHPDLLKEFTFFLPDAVQEQAKERLHRAAADSEARQAAAAARGADHKGYRAMETSQRVIDMTDGSPSGRQRMSPSSRKRPFSPRDGTMVSMQPSQPETFVYNSAVERQFFDAAKEALTAYTRDGGQAWSEFLKCLDLYAQEILSRNEMLNFVEPLLGKRNAELFEEFKRILAAAGAQPGPAPNMEDSWYSVPLAEIDFSRCRRCNTSYRALPRDYPPPPCSDRSDWEAKVLNDVWVSLPVGSEESYTFRHMRRNQHEEVLFKCEDERFEIDMVIDSNAATLRRLEPIAEEIAQLSQQEQITSDLQPNAVGSKSEEGRVGGMAGLRFKYTFDRNILGVIHRNSISRIYGDAGPEMLDLIVKNPTVAVPVVVQRLRQKDREWKAVRERLNRQWKELAETNYYKSLDHMSLSWRTTDKRASSTRTLIAEIKDRAANGGNESASSLQARIDKAKEEHGLFYEVTMMDQLKFKYDLKTLPRPDKKLFTPHMTLMYEDNSWAQRDAYRIISFALERGNTNPADKERCQRLWKDFLGPWFGLSLNWMQRPAINFKEVPASQPSDTLPSVVSTGEYSGQDDDDEESGSVDDIDLDKNIVAEELPEAKVKDGEAETSQWMDHHPLPAGAFVSTSFGEGRILEYRRDDSTYVVSLPFGKAYLLPNAVLCTVLSAEKSPYTNKLRAEDRSKLDRSDDMLMIGTQSLYLFFRLHQILIRRLGIARKLAENVPHDRSLTTLVEQMEDDETGRKRYDAYLSLVYALLDGGGHSAEGKYEDRIRCLLGHGAYELATMDKLISHLLKNIQSMGGDDTMTQLVQLFQRHYNAADGASFKPDSFRQEAAYLSGGENMYAFQMCKLPDDTDRRVLYTEYLGVIAETDDEDDSSPGGVAGTTSDPTSMETDQEPATVEAEPAAAPVPKRQRRG